MFKKLRDKITEEVQQTSLKLPVSVQQLSQLSPFTGSGGDNSEPSRSPQNSIQDELLVDISEIQPAGDNKDLFSIDEDSGEGTPSKSSEFQIIELADDLTSASSTPQKNVSTQLANNSPFDPSTPLVSTPVPLSSRGRRWSESSNISEVSGLFPIYEVPSVSFNSHIQSDLESCGSEWEDSSGGLDRLSKDTLYQAYLRMRQRYHKYKGRYNDIARAFEEKEKESEKLRDVLAKQQDKAVRRVSELREQCSLEQQAKAHLEEELRSDLEEKDHKIEALQTKVRLLQEGYLNESPFGRSPFCSSQETEKSSEEDERRANSLPPLFQSAPEVHLHESSPPADEPDNVSVGSLGSISTAPASLESDELIERLKGDIAKHKTLLSRCMDNIKSNKVRIAQLKQENDLFKSQLDERNKNIDILKCDHEKELDSLRASVESSALSMAETKQQFFEELQSKEAEVEILTKRADELEAIVKDQSEQIEELKAQSEEELEIDLERQQDGMEVKTILELESKCSELENLVADLQKSKKELELQIENLDQVNQPNQDRINELEIQIANSNNNYNQLEEVLNSSVCEKDKLNQDLAVSLQTSSKLKSENEDLNDKLRNALEGKNQINLEKAKLIQELALLTNENTHTKEILSKLNDEFDVERAKNISLVKLCDETKANCDKVFKEKEEIEGQYRCKLEEKDNLLNILEVNKQEFEVQFANSEKANFETKSALDNTCDKLANFENANDVLNNKIQELESTLTEKVMQIETLNCKFSSEFSGNEDIRKELEYFRELFMSQLDLNSSSVSIDIVSKKLKALVASKNILESKVEEFRATCANLEETLLETNSEIKQLRSRENDLQDRLFKSETCISNYKMEITEFKKKLSETEAKLSVVTAKLTSSEKYSSESTATLKEYEFKLSEYSTKLSGYESELSISCTKLSNYESLLSEANAKLETTHLKFSESCSKLEDSEKKLSELTEKLTSTELKLSDCNKNLIDCEILLSESNSSIVEYESKLTELNERLLDFERVSQNLCELKEKLQIADNKLKMKDQEIEKLQQHFSDKLNLDVALESTRKEYGENLNKMENYLKEIEKLNNSLEEKVVLVSNLQNKLQEKECQIETLNNEIETVNLHHDKTVQELNKNLESSKECAIKISKEMENEIKILAEKLNTKEIEIEKLHNELPSLAEENKKLESLLESKTRETNKLLNESSVLENDNKTLLNTKNSLECEIAEKNQIIDDLKTDENTLKENLAKFERKIISLVSEKQIILKDFEDQTAEYENSLDKKDVKYKNSLMEYEKRMEELTLECKEKVENIKNSVEKLSQEKELLQEQLVHYESLRRQKESLKKQLEESECIRNQLESTHVKRCRDIEDEWQTKLRCELERIQSEHDHKLAEAVTEALQQTRDTQLPEEVESLRRSLARKDSELARLKDMSDSLQTEVESHKEELTSVTVAMQREKEAAKELELRNCKLEHEVKDLQEKLLATEKQMENQVLCMEHSNGDLRQKIDTLQNELSTLEHQMKGETFNLETRLLKEKAESEERLKKEFEEIEKRLTNERLSAEERLREEKVHFEVLLKTSKDAEVAEKEKHFAELSSKYKNVQQEVEGLRHSRELQLQEWQDLDRDMNLLLQQDGVSEQERSRVLDEAATGVQLKIKTLYQVKNEAIKELSSLKENYKTLVDKTKEKKEKIAEYSLVNNTLEEKIKQIEQINETLSNQLKSANESNSHLEASVVSLQSQLKEKIGTISKFEADFSEIHQVVNSIPHLPPPPPKEDSHDIKSILLFLASEIDYLKKQLLEEIANSEELNKETKELRDDFLSVKQSLTESDTENNYLCSKLGETEEKLRLLQEEVQAKLSILRNADSQTIHDLITEEGVEESINQCKTELHKEYEENLVEMKSLYESKEKEIEKTWKAKMEERIHKREKEMQESLDQLTEHWNREKSEVERLTQVASVAFKSGTDSMDLLKKQVIAQRKELDDIKRNHKKEMVELQALLEVKRGRGRGSHGEVKLGVSLEDAAEFEYLKNILHQYMMGKETQTLSKVLCAVAKFSKEQQRQVIEYEENKQSLVNSITTGLGI